VTGPYEPIRPTTARWRNRRRRVQRTADNPDGVKWSKILAHTGPLSQFTYGRDHPSTWRPPLQVALICTPGSGLIAMDVDHPDAYAASRTGQLIGREQALTTRGQRYHIGIDARFVPPHEWPTQGPIRGGDIKSCGFIPAPGCEHYSGQIYAPTGILPVPAWPGLIDAMRGDRAEAEAAGAHRNGGGNGHGESIGGHDDFLARKVVFAGIMNGLRAGLRADDPRLEAMVYQAWWAAANPPEDPSDPYEPEDWPRFWCERVRRKAMAAYMAERQALDAWLARQRGGT
jgi:hypothetical protein